jgi:hypothetical protein
VLAHRDEIRFSSDPASDLSPRLRVARKAHLQNAGIGAFRRHLVAAPGRSSSSSARRGQRGPTREPCGRRRSRDCRTLDRRSSANVFGTAVCISDRPRGSSLPVRRRQDGAQCIPLAGHRGPLIDAGASPTAPPPTIDYRERLWDRRSEIATALLEIFPRKKIFQFSAI